MEVKVEHAPMKFDNRKGAHAPMTGGREVTVPIVRAIDDGRGWPIGGREEGGR